MVRTRVGYAGGEYPNPTYHDLGDHTEALEIDFDPAVLSFEALLDLFWAGHDPWARSRGTQYMAAFFFRGPTQGEQLRESVAQRETKGNRSITTVVREAGEFTLAEDYHQKYRLRRFPEFAEPLIAIYPDLRNFVDSTAATRLNGYLAGHGSRAQIERDLPQLGLGEIAYEKYFRQR